MRLVAALAFASSIVASSSVARADDPALARRLYARGEASFARGELAEALEAYSAAYEAAPLPGFLFNIGQCHRKLEHWQLARDFFTRYLEAVPDAFNRADVERLLEEVRGHLEPEPPPIPIPVPPPSTTAPTTPEPAAAPVAPPDTRRAGSRSIGLPAWISLGAGVALAGGAVYFALDLENAQAELDDPDLDCSAELARCRDLRDRGESAALLRTIFASASAATLVLAAVLVTLDLTASPETPDTRDTRDTRDTADTGEFDPRVQLSIGPAELTVRGAF